MKCSRQLVISALAVIVLSACSSSPAERRQAKDDFTYLDAKDFHQWNMPSGTELHYYPDFDVPTGQYQGEIGSKVDIRPPQQILELIPGARADMTSGDAVLWMVRQAEADKVWDTTLKALTDGKVPLVKQTDTSIETAWVRWVSKDEDSEIDARYQLSRVAANNRFGIKVSLVDWRQGGEQGKASASQKDRYTAYMTNLITTRYDEDVRREELRKARALMKHIPITMGSDRSGLPVIIARAPYEVFWQRLPELFDKLGMKIEDRNRSQGTVKVKYSELDEEFFTAHKLKPMDMTSGEYTLLLGDLGNRTSINVTNSKDKPVKEAWLEQLVPVLASVIDETAKAPAAADAEK